MAAAAATEPSSVSTFPGLAELAATPVTDSIASDALARALASPPFVVLPGTINFRAVGPVVAAGGTGRQLRSGFGFRSGNLGRITDEGKRVLTEELGVKKIFDLRVEKEVKGSPPPTIEGVEVIWVKREEEMKKPDAADFAADEMQAFANLYSDVLEVQAANYTAILRHILTSPSEPFVFHCTAGKDRTGVFSALLLSLADIPPSEIAADYALTRIGVEPGREMLLLMMERDQGFDLSEPGMTAILSSKPEYMTAFLEALHAKYGSAEGYLKTKLGFKPEEIEEIKKNLLTPI